MSKGLEQVERLVRELAEPGSVRLGEQGFDRVIAAWRDWKASGGPMDEFVDSLSEYPEAWAESHGVTTQGAAEFAAAREAAVAGFERVRRIEAGEALRGLSDPGPARPAQAGQAAGSPEGGGLRGAFEEHYASGGTVGGFARLSAADLAAIGVGGEMPEVRELAAWAAELGWSGGGGSIGWAELTEEQRDQIVDAYMVGVR